jgi:TPR repeat protein
MKLTFDQILLSKSHFSLGNNLRGIGRLEEAKESYRKAIKLNPQYAEAYNNLGTVFQDLGRSNEAEENYIEAININENNSDAYNNLGSVLQDLGRLGEAEESYKKAITLNSKFIQAIYNLGIMFYQNKQFKKAAEQFELVNFRMSKSLLLQCLYMQDDQSYFYNHLEDMIKQGDNNALIGSLVSRSNIRYGFDKNNPFCNKPFDYVLQANLFEKCNFKSIFVDGSATILSDNKIQKRSQQLLTNGALTAGNIFSQTNPATDLLQEVIRSEVDQYRTHFKDSNEGLITNWPNEYSLYGWLVSMKSGGKLKAHMHERGWISGSIYINVPSKLKSDSGNLVVCIDNEKYETKGRKNQKESIDVVTGSLCLFPASLLHYTIPFESEEERVVLAFDVVPK